MSRVPRNYFNSNFFHIMVQGINKEYIFKDELFKKVYLKFIFEESKVFNINIISFCVMDNHAHFLLIVDKIENMSMFMKQVDGKYALFYNKYRNRVGYVFRNRYKSEPIYDEKYLYQCILYIHRNPVKAGITERLDEYRYASTMKYSIKKVQEIYNYNLTKFADIDVEEYKFIDASKNQNDEEVNEIIEQTILNTMKKLNIKSINKKDRYVMKTIIKEIREKTNASMEVIARRLKISKSSVSRYLKEV